MANHFSIVPLRTPEQYVPSTWDKNNYSPCLPEIFNLLQNPGALLLKKMYLKDSKQLKDVSNTGLILKEKVLQDLRIKQLLQYSVKMFKGGLE